MADADRLKKPSAERLRAMICATVMRSVWARAWQAWIVSMMTARACSMLPPVAVVNRGVRWVTMRLRRMSRGLGGLLRNFFHY